MLDSEEKEVSSRGRLDLLLEQWGGWTMHRLAQRSGVWRCSGCNRLAQMTQHRLGIMASW